METGDWLLDTRYLILDIGCWLLGTIAHEFDIYGPSISDFGLRIADFMFARPLYQMDLTYTVTTGELFLKNFNKLICT